MLHLHSPILKKGSEHECPRMSRQQPPSEQHSTFSFFLFQFTKYRPSILRSRYLSRYLVEKGLQNMPASSAELEHRYQAKPSNTLSKRVPLSCLNEFLREDWISNVFDKKDQHTCICPKCRWTWARFNRGRYTSTFQAVPPLLPMPMIIVNDIHHIESKFINFTNIVTSSEWLPSPLVVTTKESYFDKMNVTH